MSQFLDKVFGDILAVATHIVFHPKVYYVDKSIQKNRLTEPTILVSNHINHIDGTIIGTVFHKNIVHHLAAKDRFENKGMGWYLRHNGCIPIDRQNLDTSWIYQSIDVLRNKKENICIYPEGRHGKNREILPFHSGVTTLAAMTRVPIVMIYNDGPYNFFKRTKIIVSTPIHLNPPTNGMTADYIKEETENLRNKMLELQKEFIRQNKK